MMLSDQDIRAALKNGELSITPFLETSIRGVGVTFHLGPDLLRPIAGTVVDIRRRTLPEYEQITMSDDKPFQLDPQQFVLGHTLEKVTVGPQIGFFIEGRSTLGRIGLTVVKTAMIVQPGHRDRVITLELANHGPNPILLYPKMKIAKAAVFKLNSPTSKAYDDTGKYRDQATVGRPVFSDEFMPD